MTKRSPIKVENMQYAKAYFFIKTRALTIVMTTDLIGESESYKLKEKMLLCQLTVNYIN